MTLELQWQASNAGAAHAVCEELADGLYPNVKFVGSGVRKRAGKDWKVCVCWIGHLGGTGQDDL